MNSIKLDIVANFNIEKIITGDEEYIIAQYTNEIGEVMSSISVKVLNFRTSISEVGKKWYIISDMYTRIDYQRRGLASSLLQNIITRFCEGINSALVCNINIFNIIAISMLNKFGFQVSGNIAPINEIFLDDVEYIMIKEFKP